jgi:hypothetical protein
MFKYLILENILTHKECQQIIETYEPLLAEPIKFTNYQHS